MRFSPVTFLGKELYPEHVGDKRASVFTILFFFANWGLITKVKTHQDLFRYNSDSYLAKSELWHKLIGIINEHHSSGGLVAAFWLSLGMYGLHIFIKKFYLEPRRRHRMFRPANHKKSMLPIEIFILTVTIILNYVTFY